MPAAPHRCGSGDPLAMRQSAHTPLLSNWKGLVLSLSKDGERTQSALRQARRGGRGRGQRRGAPGLAVRLMALSLLAATAALLALSLRNYGRVYVGFTRWHEIEALLRGGDAERAVEDMRRMPSQLVGSRRYELQELRARAVQAGSSVQEIAGSGYGVPPATAGRVNAEDGGRKKNREEGLLSTPRLLRYLAGRPAGRVAR